MTLSKLELRDVGHSQTMLASIDISGGKINEFSLALQGKTSTLFYLSEEQFCLRKSSNKGDIIRSKSIGKKLLCKEDIFFGIYSLSELGGQAVDKDRLIELLDKLFFLIKHK